MKQKEFHFLHLMKMFSFHLIYLTVFYKTFKLNDKMIF